MFFFVLSLSLSFSQKATAYILYHVICYINWSAGFFSLNRIFPIIPTKRWIDFEWSHDSYPIYSCSIWNLLPSSPMFPRFPPLGLFPFGPTPWWSLFWARRLDPGSLRPVHGKVYGNRPWLFLPRPSSQAWKMEWWLQWPSALVRKVGKLRGGGWGCLDHPMTCKWLQ